MADEIIRLDYSAEDIGDNIDEVREARGTFDTLDERLDNIEGGGPSPSNPIASNCVSPMTGYSKSSSSTPGNISTDDTLNAAIGKLEKRTELNENNILYIKQANGKKNLIPYFDAITNGGCTYTYGAGGVVTVTGTKSGALSIATLIDNANLSEYGLSAGDSIVLVSDNANIGTVVIFEDAQGTQDAAISAYNEVKTVTIPSGRTKWYVRLQVKPATTGTINETAKPMICDKKLYDIDSSFTPYAMSNAEITAWILAHS